MADDLTFEFLLDDGEQVRAAALVARRRGGQRVWRWLGLGAVGVLLMLALMLRWSLLVLWPYVVIIAIVSTAQLFVPTVQRWQMRRMFRESPTVRGPLTYSFAETGLSLRTPITSAEIAWAGIEEATETPDMFIMFVGKRFAYYIPKRVVGARESQLRSFLRQRLGERAVALSSGI